jgi:hypothetical protein
MSIFLNRRVPGVSAWLLPVLLPLLLPGVLLAGPQKAPLPVVKEQPVSEIAAPGWRSPIADGDPDVSEGAVLDWNVIWSNDCETLPGDFDIRVYGADAYSRVPTDPDPDFDFESDEHDSSV